MDYFWQHLAIAQFHEQISHSMEVISTLIPKSEEFHYVC